MHHKIKLLFNTTFITHVKHAAIDNKAFILHIPHTKYDYYIPCAIPRLIRSPLLHDAYLEYITTHKQHFFLLYTTVHPSVLWLYQTGVILINFSTLSTKLTPRELSLLIIINVSIRRVSTTFLPQLDIHFGDIRRIYYSAYMLRFTCVCQTFSLVSGNLDKLRNFTFIISRSGKRIWTWRRFTLEYHIHFVNSRNLLYVALCSHTYNAKTFGNAKYDSFDFFLYTFSVHCRNFVELR